MEKNGHKYLIKLSSFLKIIKCRVNRSTVKAQEEVKKSFINFFLTKIRSVNTKPRFKVGDKKLISINDIPF